MHKCEALPGGTLNIRFDEELEYRLAREVQMARQTGSALAQEAVATDNEALERAERKLPQPSASCR